MTVLVAYATMSGHTEELAEMIQERLEQADVTVVVKEAMDVEVSELREYELIVVGSFTWGDGDVPEEMDDLYGDLEDTDLSGLSFAVFGSGDSGYAHFAGAVDHLTDAIRQQNGTLVADSVKVDIDNDVDETEELIDAFTEQIRAAREDGRW
ncbi:flavodoxin domain-containing protein [Alkalicoccus urumqiensis]|nr:flavodoxin domain-containing protein [Alkalicoccus urumqiensis]